jgi:hypothetical protein
MRLALDTKNTKEAKKKRRQQNLFFDDSRIYFSTTAEFIFQRPNMFLLFFFSCCFFFLLCYFCFAFAILCTCPIQNAVKWWQRWSKHPQEYDFDGQAHAQEDESGDGKLAPKVHRHHDGVGLVLDALVRLELVGVDGQHGPHYQDGCAEGHDVASYVEGHAGRVAQSEHGPLLVKAH